MKWKSRESLLYQNATNSTGTKFYQCGVAYDAQTDMWFAMVNWGAGTPVLDFTSGQTQCLGAFKNQLAAQSEADKKLTAKQKRGYFPYNGSEDETELAKRIADIAMAASPVKPAFPEPAPTTPVPTPEKSRESDVTWVMALDSLNDTQMQQALVVRQNLLNDRAKLLDRLDVIESQVELINAKLVS